MDKLVLLLVGFILPPLAALLTDGVGVQLLLNVILTFFGWLPGVLHSWWLVLRKK